MSMFRCQSRPSSSPFRSPLSSAMTTDRKSTRLNSSHGYISYAVFCLKKKKQRKVQLARIPPSAYTDHMLGELPHYFHTYPRVLALDSHHTVSTLLHVQSRTAIVSSY